ncbi:MAG: SufE family protein [Alphaproteobacteria bacterium]|nr:SufE family protein [Alphaproteobacteria bacterium]MBR2342522.1 SufE family protein [Alphaproteobacteria bacterium]MBR2483021.1 SufE family protein [Alphaproteobacteria bacterium]
MTFAEIKDILCAIENPVEKLEMVMDLGRILEPVPDNAVCTEIHGCASRVEICVLGNRYFAVADSALVRGIVAILIAMVDGKSAQEIKQMDIAGEFAALDINLGAGRLNGLNSMISFLQNL